MEGVKTLRKLIVIILLMVAMICSAYAEVDLSSMTTDELKELYTQVSTELFGRGLSEGVRLYDGTYLIGTDIPVGRYLLMTNGYSESYDYAFVEGYNAEGDEVTSVLGRMSAASPGLLIDITEEVVSMRIGTSENVSMVITLPSAIWTK